MKFPEIFNYDNACSGIRDGFELSVLNFKALLLFVLEIKYNLQFPEINYQNYPESCSNGNLMVKLPTGDTVGSKMLQCEVSTSGLVHFDILCLEENRGATPAPQLVWGIMHEAPLSFDKKEYWQTPEDFSEYLPEIAKVLKR